MAKVSVFSRVTVILYVISCIASGNLADDFPELNLKSGDIQLKTIQNRDVYKATQYEDYDLQTAADSLGKADWSGVYFAFDETTAEDYGHEYLGFKDKGIFYLNKVRVDRELTVLQIKNRAYGLGTIPQEDKAAKLREFFKNNGLGDRNDQENPLQNFDDVSNSLKKTFSKGRGENLMPTLGDMKMGLQCPHEEKDELILHSNIVGSVRVTERYIKLGFMNGELETFRNMREIPSAERKRILASRENKSSSSMYQDPGLRQCTKGGVRRCGTSNSPKRKHG